MENCQIPGCEKPVDRVMAGDGYCAHHGPADRLPEVAIVRRRVCGTATPYPGLAVCDGHAAAYLTLDPPPKAEGPLTVTLRTP